MEFPDNLHDTKTTAAQHPGHHPDGSADNPHARMRALENSKRDKHNVTVIGAGAFGTAMAVLCARNGHPVKMYARDQAQCDSINTVHINSKYLSEFTLPDIITATSNLTVHPSAPHGRIDQPVVGDLSRGRRHSVAQQQSSSHSRVRCQWH